MSMPEAAAIFRRSSLATQTRVLWLTLLLWSMLAAISTSDDKPSFDQSLQVVGRFASAQACPVAADRALTAAHVVDPMPFDSKVPTTPLRWSTADGTSGRAYSPGVHVDADLAELRPAGNGSQFPGFYPLASAAPEVREILYFYGYETRSRRGMFAPRRFEGRVLRILAGHLILDEAPDFGTSGSCVLNSRGEVVGIVSRVAIPRGARDIDDGAVVIVGVWGFWSTPVAVGPGQ